MFVYTIFIKNKIHIYVSTFDNLPNNIYIYLRIYGQVYYIRQVDKASYIAWNSVRIYSTTKHSHRVLRRCGDELRLICIYYRAERVNPSPSFCRQERIIFLVFFKFFFFQNIQYTLYYVYTTNRAKRTRIIYPRENRRPQRFLFIYKLGTSNIIYYRNGTP